MSMWLEVIVMKEAAFEALRTDPALCAGLLEGDATTLQTLGLTSADSAGVDYLSIARAVEAMAEAMGEEDDEPTFEEEGTLDWEATYGPAMWWSPKTFPTALQNGSVWELALEMDDDFAALIERATAEALYVVAVIN